jgi:hypothetical protein
MGVGEHRQAGYRVRAKTGVGSSPPQDAWCAGRGGGGAVRPPPAAPSTGGAARRDEHARQRC